jgi:hypothetical protein
MAKISLANCFAVLVPRNCRVADDAEAIGLAPVYFGCTSLEAIAENFCYNAIAYSSVEGV